MKIGTWAKAFLAAAPLLAGCKGFWDPPSSASFTLTSSGAIAVSPGATTGNTSTVVVTPSNSFSGTVVLTCAVTAPSGASNPATCSLSPTSVTVSGTSAVTSTLTATTAANTTAGAYQATVTGVSGSVSKSTTVCIVVGTSSNSCSKASTSGKFYVLTSSSIAGYSISSDQLSAISGSSYNLSGASAMAIAPSGAFLYVASAGGGITLFTINSSTGALSQGTGVFADTEAAALQIDPSGKWLLDASLVGNGTLTAYPITSAGIEDISRSSQSVQLANPSVNQMAISPNGALISVALGSKGTESFTFMADNSSPIGAAYTPITRPYGSGGAIAVAIDSKNRLLYVGETAAFPSSNSHSGALRVFTIGTNSLSELSYSAPYAPSGTGPHAILPSLDGNYVYAASWQSGSSGTIAGYSVATSGLTPLSNTVATGTEPTGLAEDNTDSFVLAVNHLGSPLFGAYTFDAATPGQLDASITGSTASNPIAIVAKP